MIAFFRKLRQRLLVENQFGRYLLYALGEVLLVMVGILLALQVDNWNEQRKEREIETGILQDLQTEFGENLSDANKVFEGTFTKLPAEVSCIVITNIEKNSRNISPTRYAVNFKNGKKVFI